MGTNLLSVGPNFCGTAVWNLLRVTLLDQQNFFDIIRAERFRNQVKSI
jgi:hypothetical protein